MISSCPDLIKSSFSLTLTLLLSLISVKSIITHNETIRLLPVIYPAYTTNPAKSSCLFKNISHKHGPPSWPMSWILFLSILELIAVCAILQ